MVKATEKQLYALKKLIATKQPSMILPENLTKNMASQRISYLLKKKPGSKDLYNT